jgi:hypothetical protein
MRFFVNGEPKRNAVCYLHQLTIVAHFILFFCFYRIIAAARVSGTKKRRVLISYRVKYPSRIKRIIILLLLFFHEPFSDTACVTDQLHYIYAFG